MRKCGLEGMGQFLLDFLHELRLSVLLSGEGTLVAPQAYEEGLVPEIYISK